MNVVTTGLGSFKNREKDGSNGEFVHVFRDILVIYPVTFLKQSQQSQGDAMPAQ